MYNLTSSCSNNSAQVCKPNSCCLCSQVATSRRNSYSHYMIMHMLQCKLADFLQAENPLR